MAGTVEAMRRIWATEEKLLFVDLVNEGKSMEECAKALKEKFGVVRTPKACERMVIKLRHEGFELKSNIGHRRHREWNTEERQALVDLNKEYKSVEGIRKHMRDEYGVHRSETVIVAKLKELKELGSTAFVARGEGALPPPAKRNSQAPPTDPQPAATPAAVTPEDVTPPPRTPEQTNLDFNRNEEVVERRRAMRKGIPGRLCLERSGNTFALIENQDVLISISIAQEWFEKDDEGIRERCWDLLHDIMRLKCAY